MSYQILNQVVHTSLVACRYTLSFIAVVNGVVPDVCSKEDVLLATSEMT